MQLAVMTDRTPEPDPFARVVERHQAAVAAVAYASLGDRTAAEEVAQETFLIAWRKLGAGEQVPRMAAWLCGIARFVARNARRRRGREEADAELDARPSAGPSPLDAALEREAAETVRRALAALPEPYREPLVLYYFTGESVREVADALALSEETVKQRLSRGRRRLEAAVGEVERTLGAARPGPAFTAAVVAALAAGGVGAAEAQAARPLPAAGAGLGAAAIAVAAAAAVAIGGGAVWLARGHDDGRVRAAPRTAAPPRATAAPAAAAASPSPPSTVVSVAARDRLRRGPAAPPAAPAAPAAPVTTAAEDAAWARLQRHVDLDFGQADVYDVLRLLSDVTETPILVEGEIAARVNVRLRDVTALDALDEMLRQAGAERTEVPALRVFSGGSCDVAGLLDGEPVSIDLAGAPLRDVLAAIGRALDLPIGVHGALGDTPVTVRLDQVPAAQALDQVLRGAGLGCESSVAFEVRPAAE